MKERGWAGAGRLTYGSSPECGTATQVAVAPLYVGPSWRLGTGAAPICVYFGHLSGSKMLAALCMVLHESQVHVSSCLCSFSRGELCVPSMLLWGLPLVWGQMSSLSLCGLLQSMAQSKPHRILYYSGSKSSPPI